MGAVTVASDEVRVVDAVTDDGRVLIEPERLDDALGWTLTPEGLCRAEVCAPVRDRDSLFEGDLLDLSAVARALGRLVVVDADAGVVAVSLPSEQRREALDGLHAPSFTLPDLDGAPHALEEWRGTKKLLVAFASW